MVLSESFKKRNAIPDLYIIRLGWSDDVVDTALLMSALSEVLAQYIIGKIMLKGSIFNMCTCGNTGRLVTSLMSVIIFVLVIMPSLK